jgi:Skp family chaperone for outer membrane proteins
MKTFCLKSIASGICLLAFAFSTHAETKIATIDLSKVFKDYYKTVLADAAIKNEVTGLEKDRKALVDDYQKSTDDYKKALDEANNQAVSADEREKRKKEAEGKLIKINDLRQSIEQFDRTAKGQMDEKMRQTRDKIVEEIKNVVSSKAKNAGYTLVMDTSAADPGGRPPVVLYSSGENDLTAAVLAQLNANAPADLPKSDNTKDEKK